MISRYTRPAMGAIWEDENRYRIWLEIEVLACEAQAQQGVIPAEAVAVIRAKANFDVQRIEAIEEEVRHDVIAFLTNVGEYVGPEARFIHLGMTSSDVLDTALAVQMKQSGDMAPLRLLSPKRWMICSSPQARSKSSVFRVVKVSWGKA